MADVKKYRIWCTTDSQWEYAWSESEPSTCPVDTGHAIDGARTTVVETKGPGSFTPEGTQITRLDGKLGLHREVVVQPVAPQGGGGRIVSHNLCDKRTWWQESEEHLGLTFTDSGDGITWNMDDAGPIISVREGLLVFEDGVDESTVSPNGNTMTSIVPKVYDNGTLIGDSEYVIDSSTGSITFDSAMAGPITMDCRKPKSTSGASKFTWTPKAGQMMVVEDAEADMTENYDHAAPVRVDVYGSHPVITGGTVAIVDTKLYKTFHDFHAAAREFYGPIPAGMGGAGGVNSPKWTFRWNYLRSDVIHDTVNYVHDNHFPGEVSERSVTLHKIEVSIVGDEEFGGDILTLIMFAGSEPEPT